MQSINVFENGIGYLGECLTLYQGSCAYILLFIAGVLYVLLKGTKEEKNIFMPCTIAMLLTVYNPLAPVVIDKFFDISSEYYRLFWITPVIVLVPFVASKLLDGKKDTGEKTQSSAIVLMIAIAVLAGNYVYTQGIPFAQNVYKVPDELIEVSDIIHSDCDGEYPKAFFEYEYNMQIRQYDPKMLLTIDREDYIYAVNYSYTDDMIADEVRPTNRILAVLVRNQNVDRDDFIRALEDTKTEYIVLTKGHHMTGYILEAGLRPVEDTATHCVYKYDIKEPSHYELIDYSDVEHKFSFRRIK